jgi:hypothetical protein
MSLNRLRATIFTLIGVVLVVVFVIWVISARQQAQQRLEEQTQRYRQEWIDRSMTELQSGKTDLLYLYSTQDTDGLLKTFAGMPEVRRIGFESSDVTEEGIKTLLTFPNLQELKLYGRPSVDDDGLQHLSGNPSLEKLELINTDVTDRGLEVLTTMPNLRSLTLYREAFRDVTLTDQAVLTLVKLKNLEELIIDGGWASNAVFEQLRAELPNCRISSDSEW